MYSTYPPDYSKNTNSEYQVQSQVQQPQFNANVASPSNPQAQMPGSYSNQSSQQSYPTNPALNGYSYSGKNEIGMQSSYLSATLADFSPQLQLNHSAPIQQSVSLQNPTFQIQQRPAMQKNANAKTARLQQMSRKPGDFQRTTSQMSVTSHPSSPLTNAQPNRQHQNEFNSTVGASPRQQRQNVASSPINQNQNEMYQQQQQKVENSKSEEIWSMRTAGTMPDYGGQSDRQSQNVQLPFRGPPPANPTDSYGSEVVEDHQQSQRRQFSHLGVRTLKHDQFPNPMDSSTKIENQQPQLPPQRIYVHHHQPTEEESRRTSVAATASNGKIYFRQSFDQGPTSCIQTFRKNSGIRQLSGHVQQQIPQRPAAAAAHASTQMVAYNQQFIGSPIVQPQQQLYSGVESQRLYMNPTVMIGAQQQLQHHQQMVMASPLPKPTTATVSMKPKPEYRELKKKFKYMIYENEYYQEELRNLQRKLLKLSRDKNFLLDRLQGYEHVSNSSDDSDASMKTVQDQPQKVKKRTPTSSRSGVLNSGRKRGSITSADNGGTSHTNCGMARTINYYSTGKSNSGAAQSQRYAEEQRLDQTDDRIQENKSGSWTQNQSNHAKPPRHHFANPEQRRNNDVQEHFRSGNGVLTKNFAGNTMTGRVSNKQRHSVAANSLTFTSNKSADPLNGNAIDSEKKIKKESAINEINVEFLSPDREMGKDSLDDYTPAVIVSCAAPSSSSSASFAINEAESPKRKFVRRNENNKSPIYRADASKSIPLKDVKSESDELKKPISANEQQLKKPLELSPAKSPTANENAEKATG